ncbi:MAG: hypothetical protein J6U54_07620 [Clostridiales bacterium]|nr:hypothetical protein [Clostridiales bacterium]
MKEWSLDDDRINELEKKVRSLERKVKRRDNRIIELEKENKSLKACNKHADLRIQELEDILENLSVRVNGRPNY